MTPDIRINKLVSEFVDNITQLARQATVATITSALAGIATSSANGASRRAVSPGKRSLGRGRGAKRSPGDLQRLRTRFLDHVKANPGQRIEQINRALGTRTAELRGPVTNMVSDGQVRTKGQRRGMTYFATR